MLKLDLIYDIKVIKSLAITDKYIFHIVKLIFTLVKFNIH